MKLFFTSQYFFVFFACFNFKSLSSKVFFFHILDEVNLETFCLIFVFDVILFISKFLKWNVLSERKIFILSLNEISLMVGES